MGKRPKKEYVDANITYLKEIASQSDTLKLDKGVMYKIIKSGDSQLSPKINEVVSVHYRGTTIDGREFDSSLNNSYPETFRLREVIEGWQIALLKMKIGDKWSVFIPSEVGYGDRSTDKIPGASTLIFEVELISIS